MAGTLKDITVEEIQQGPGDLWALAEAPDDGDRIVLAEDGTPDAGTHGASTHLGAMSEGLTTIVKPKAEGIQVDSYDAPVAMVSTAVEASIEATLAQISLPLLGTVLGAGAYSAGAGFKQVTFGGGLSLSELCLAAVSKKRGSYGYIASVLYRAVASGGLQLALGRAKAAAAKAKFTGLADVERSVGAQVGSLLETLVAAAGGTPTARAVTVADIQQGPCDLWVLGTAPLDAAVRPTLHTDLTPDATAHPASVHLGTLTDGCVVTVTPKIEFVPADQYDAPILGVVTGLECSIEATLAQTQARKLQRLIGAGTLGTDDDPGPATYEEITFGGTLAMPSFCVAAIAPKRADAAKVYGACLYKVSSAEGVTLTMARSAPATYKVKFTGLADVARTSGKQVGVIWETV